MEKSMKYNMACNGVSCFVLLIDSIRTIKAKHNSYHGCVGVWVCVGGWVCGLKETFGISRRSKLQFELKIIR